VTDQFDEILTSLSEENPLAPSGFDFFEKEDGRSISARGTEDGLVIRIDGRAEWTKIIEDIEHFLGSRKKFFEGGKVSLEWLERLPTKEQSLELEEKLKGEYGIEVSSRKRNESSAPVARAKKQSTTIQLFENANDKKFVSATELNAVENEFNFEDIIEDQEYQKVSLGKAIESARESVSKGFSSRKMSQVLTEDLIYEDDANGKVYFGTLRSGQRIETPFSLVVVGDVNPGADLIAGGDIIVLGSLRGTAHASAYDSEASDKVIIAFQMQPMQLRIGSVISRGSEQPGKGMEIAHIEDRRIIVENFNSRLLGGRKFS